MKKILLSITAVSALAAATVVPAVASAQSVNQRQAMLERRIDQGLRNGSLSRGEAYRLRAELRDTEQVPLLEEGGIEAFIRREVLPYTPDAWIKEDAKIGYEVSFTRHFYKPQPLRTLEEISKDKYWGLINPYNH